MSSTTFHKSLHAPPPLPLRRRIYSALAITLIWTISLIVLLLGLPLIIFQAATRSFHKR